MITYLTTTVFNSNAQTLVNTINCNGVMGAGLALEFKLRYPQMYSNYVSSCREGKIKVGQVYLYHESSTTLILNFPTKKDWKYPSKLEWISTGLEYFVTHYQQWGITSIAFPKLGCDRGGLDWNQVKPLMEKYLAPEEDLQIYICLDSAPQAEGIEKQMLDSLNNTDTWSNSLKIKPNIFKIINQAKPIKRFRDLQKIAGIGKETYQEIFRFLYSQSLISSPAPVAETAETVEFQLSLSLTTTNIEIVESKPLHNEETVITEVVESKPQHHQDRQTEVINNTNKVVTDRSVVVRLLHQLGLEIEEIRLLTWDRLLEEGNNKFIALSDDKKIMVEAFLWQDLQSFKGNAKGYYFIISHKKTNKPLVAKTIIDLLNDRKKSVKKDAECEQLEIPFLY